MTVRKQQRGSRYSRIGLIRRKSESPSQWLAYLLLGCTCLAGVLCWETVDSLRLAHLSAVALTVLLFRLGVEISASFFAIGSLLSALVYLFIRERSVPKGALRGKAVEDLPRVGILYICCDDFDEHAFRSLMGLRYDGPLHIIVHDDSHSLESRKQVEHAVHAAAHRHDIKIQLIRRPSRDGGKSAVVNYVLQQTGHLYDIFLLCDNDTTVVDRHAIEKALPFFEDDRIAIVQCRSVAVDSADYGEFNRILCRAIDVFHLFLTASSRYGWSIFIGHNAFLRTSAVREAGGFTPGFFSDDLDLTVRLNVAGYRVAYAGAVHIGEKHPSNYSAFRRRTYKWSYGCVQILRSHAGTVLFSSQFTLAEKVSFFFFNGFYVAQSVLLAYVIVSYIFAPLVQGLPRPSVVEQALVATIITGLVFVPTITYFVKNREFGRAISSVVACGVVYGSTDFVCTRGVWDALWRRKRQWLPTNAIVAPQSDRVVLGEAAFAAATLVLVAFTAPELIYMPSTYLFVGKFLFAPAISVLYRPPISEFEATTEDAAA